MSDSPIVERETDASAVFSAVSDPTRVEILKALWAAEDREATFSELREAVDVDDSGRFNYHISKLRGSLIGKADGKYRFRLAGVRLVGGLLSGAYTQTGEAGPVAIPYDCPHCDGDVSFRYEDEAVRFTCDDCEETVASFAVPPSVFAGVAPGEFPEVAERYARTLITRSREGFCVNCEGSVAPVVERASDVVVPAVDDTRVPDDLAFVEFECRRCGQSVNSDLANALYDHPAVVSFFYDHGIDVEDVPIWEMMSTTTDRAEVIESEPFRAVVRYEAGGETLTLTVDDDLSVVDTSRDSA